MSIRLSVVVATRDRPELLEGCLASLRLSLGEGDELIVVDSASRDASAIRDLASTCDAVYVRCDEPGASRARNTGWRASKGEVVAFIDDDTRVEPVWADALSKAFSGQTNRIDFATGRLSLLEEYRIKERPVAVFESEEPFTIALGVDEPFGHGANHAVRRAALERIGGFDQRLGAGEEFRAAEDVDMWDRLLEAGFVGRYLPDAVAWHVQWRRRRHFVKLDWSYGYGGGVRLSKLLRVNRRRARRSMRHFVWEWGIWLAMRHLWYHQVFLAGIALLRVMGGVAGFARGIVIPLSEGHLAPRQASQRSA